MRCCANQLAELHDLETQRDSLQIVDEGTIREYYELRQQLTTYTRDMRKVTNHPNHCLQFMQSGRLIKIKHREFDFGWGAVVSFAPVKRGKEQKMEESTPQDSYVIDVLLEIADSSIMGPRASQALPQGIRPAEEGDKVKMEIVPILLSCVESIGHVRIFLPSDLRLPEQRNTVRKALDEVKRRFPDGIAVLDPIENMGITEASFKKLLRVSLTFSTLIWLKSDNYRKLKFLNHVSCLTLYITLLVSLTYTNNSRRR